MILDDHDDDDGIGNGRDQEQRYVHADEQYAPDLSEFHLRRRELGDQLLDDRRLLPVVFRPQLTAVAVVALRHVVEHFAAVQCRSRSGRVRRSTVSSMPVLPSPN